MLASLALALFLQQAPPQADQCHLRCGEAMERCLAACQGGKDAKAPQNRQKVMACLKTCGDQQEPCLDACDKAKK